MSYLGGIWVTPQPVAINFSAVAGVVTVTIAEDCLAQCVDPVGNLILIGGVPAGYRPSGYSATSTFPVQNNNTILDGIGIVTPQGDMSIVTTFNRGWQLDPQNQSSGVKATSFTYRL